MNIDEFESNREPNPWDESPWVRDESWDEENQDWTPTPQPTPEGDDDCPF